MATEISDSIETDDNPSTSSRPRSKSADGRSLVDREIYNKYTMAVTKDSLQDAFEFLRTLPPRSDLAPVTGKKAIRNTSWADVDGALIFLLNTSGCRWNVLLASFRDVSLRDGVVLLCEDCCECNLDLGADAETEVRHGFKIKECIRWQDAI